MKPVLNVYQSLYCISLIQLYTTAAPLIKVRNSYQVTTFTLLYTNVVMWTSLTGLATGILLKFREPTSTSTILQNLTPLAISVGCLEVTVSVVSCVVSNLHQQISKYKHIDLIDSYAKLDAILIKEFQVKMNYHKIVRKNIILVVSFTSYFLIMSFRVLSNLMEGDEIFMIVVGICYLYIYIAPAASSYAAMNFAELLKIRFRLLQKLLDPEYLKKKFQSDKIRFAKIAILIRQYQDMFEIVKKISEVYGLSLLMVHFHDFTMTTSQLFFIYWKSTDGTDNTTLFVQFGFWMLPIIWKTIFLPLYMHIMLNEAEECVHLLLRTDEHFPTESIKEAIDTFALWNRHNYRRISVGGFFNSDLTLGFAICSAVASYLLVLIQFKMQEDGS